MKIKIVCTLLISFLLVNCFMFSIGWVVAADKKENTLYTWSSSTKPATTPSPSTNSTTTAKASASPSTASKASASPSATPKPSASSSSTSKASAVTSPSASPKPSSSASPGQETTEETAAEVADGNPLNLESPSAVLIEQTTGQILYSHNAHEKLRPASVTKIMSILLIMEQIEKGNLKYDDQISCSENASAMGGSQIWLDTSETLSVHDMLKAICVVSANDYKVQLRHKKF